VRLFFGVFPPSLVQQELAAAQSVLRGNWKPVQEKQLHLTLAFLGDVAAGALPGLKRAGKKAAAAVSPFDARVKGTGYFPATGRPRVWFARVEGEGLEPLATALRGELAELLDDDHDFRAHITLARRKGPAPRVGPRVFDLSFPVDGFSLVESTLTPRGPVYEIVEHFSLKERESGGTK